MRFRDLPGVGQELARLIEAERECCGLLQWNLSREGSGWLVEVCGADEAIHAMPFLSSESLAGTVATFDRQGCCY